MIRFAYYHNVMNTSAIKIFKSLSDPTRMKVLMLLQKKKEETCQNLMMEFALTQSAMSRHFNKMVDGGVLSGRREGALWFYSINRDYLKKSGIDIDEVLENYRKETN